MVFFFSKEIPRWFFSFKKTGKFLWKFNKKHSFFFFLSFSLSLLLQPRARRKNDKNRTEVKHPPHIDRINFFTGGRSGERRIVRWTILPNDKRCRRKKFKKKLRNLHYESRQWFSRMIFSTYIRAVTWNDVAPNFVVCCLF